MTGSRIKYLENSEWLGALIEGDIVETENQGNMIYTEKHGPPRLIKQFDMSRILSARVDGKNGDKMDIKEEKVVIEKGSFIDVYSSNMEYGWIQYDLNQSIINQVEIAEGVKRFL